MKDDELASGSSRTSEGEIERSEVVNYDDDDGVFGDDVFNDQRHISGLVGEVSDIPRLRMQHSTAGYRDGIAHAKTESVQEGFDEGYPLGSRLGTRVGALVGLLEGLVAASENPTSSTSTTLTSRPSFSTQSSTEMSRRRGDGKELHPMNNLRGKKAIDISYGEVREGEVGKETKDIGRQSEAENGKDVNDNSKDDNDEDQEMMTTKIEDRISQLLRDAKRELLDLSGVVDMMTTTGVVTVEGDAVDDKDDQILHYEGGYGDAESDPVRKTTVSATTPTIATIGAYTAGNPNASLTLMNSSQSKTMEERLDKWMGIIRHELSSLGLHIELDQPL